MRKLTGYIGALIIVFALMGSILAGYALNVNGSSSVINEYEKVTDVSGLYSHSQEPSYIDYNPASNYIRYSTESVEYNNPTGTGTLTFKKIENGGIGIDTYNQVYINGHIDAVVNINPYFAVVSDKFYCYFENGSSTLTLYDGVRNVSHNGITSITKNDSSVTITMGGNTYTYNDVHILLARSNNNPDYYLWSTYVDGTNRDIYLNDISQCVSVIRYPNLGINYNGSWFSTYNPFGRTADFDIYQSYVNVNDNVNKYTFGLNTSNPSYLIDSLAYPISVNSIIDLGINYTTSNRVNNYPVPGNNETPTTTQNQTINISNLSGITNYYPANQYDYHVVMYKNNNVGMSNVGVKYSNIGLEMPYKPVNGDQYEMVNYKLSDILTNGAIIPANTKTIKIELNSNNQVAYNRNLNQTNVISYCDLNIPCLNNGTFQNTTVPVSHFRNYTMETNNGFGTKDYAIYNIQDNTVTVYSYDGVKKSVLAPENCYIVSPKLSGFDPSNQRLMVYSYEYREPSNGNNYWEITEYYTSNAQGYPYSDSNNYTTNINLTYYIQENPNNEYFDITKGYSIKNDNVTNVIWDNEYNNGNIQLLFRAENASAIYHNDIIVGDNTISINYNDGFSVTLNGGDPVAVGKWRNIVLNIDLRNGELSAIPVRTFNSYTNVVLDTASIVIGDMMNPSPTNIIEWAPTANSLMFNVYSTAVFMNTYGVVMVNPELNITEYFTDLNGFYRMRLYNFSVLGSSITVNGITADVSNNSITINEQTVQVKDMAITYADGHAYISDSNVNIDLGEIVNNNISMLGAWYFETELLKGYTSQKMVYTWDWGDFILNNIQFCIMYMGIALIGLIVARRYCSLSIIDYLVLIASFAIALTVQVIA